MINASKNRYVCSPMNYIGGKHRLLSQILPLFPTQIDTFVDLFCGGCNVGINVSAGEVIFNDNLTHLINLYTTFAENSKESILKYVEEQISRFELSLTNEEGYKQLRESYNLMGNPLDLFVLVAYSFNHQIRFNNSHQFNNPFGRERSCFNERMRTNLIAFIDRLHSKRVQFRNCNFDQFDLSELGEHDFVYCDPPYLITTGTYNDGKRGFTGWNETQEASLLELLNDLNRRGVKFALSNVLEHKGRQNSLLDDWVRNNNYIITPINKNYANSNYQTSDKDGRATVEVLVTNYQPTVEQKELF